MSNNDFVFNTKSSVVIHNEEGNPILNIVSPVEYWNQLTREVDTWSTTPSTTNFSADNGAAVLIVGEDNNLTIKNLCEIESKLISEQTA